MAPSKYFHRHIWTSNKKTSTTFKKMKYPIMKYFMYPIILRVAYLLLGNSLESLTSNNHSRHRLFLTKFEQLGFDNFVKKHCLVRHKANETCLKKEISEIQQFLRSRPKPKQFGWWDTIWHRFGSISPLDRKRSLLTWDTDLLASRFRFNMP